MPWTRHTLSSLRRRLEERVELQPFWTPTEARDALNEGLAFWNLLTGTWKQKVTLHATPSNDPLLALPSTLVFGMRVAFEGRPLALDSLAGCFRGRPGWWTETTATGGDVPTRPMIWAPVSLRLIAVWPTPATITIDAWTIDGVAATPVLVTPEEGVDLEDGVLEPLLGYSLHAMALKEGWARFESTIDLMRGFLQVAAEHNSQLTATAAYRQYMGLDRKDLRPSRGVGTRQGPELERLGGTLG